MIKGHAMVSPGRAILYVRSSGFVVPGLEPNYGLKVFPRDNDMGQQCANC